ncbi:hypothetical protein PGTUg99_024495 [Puccinia graminis f. sp. tritici]|uniref:SGNH hydrolase-type esterase domain-containing protein n=1 Tax=Puccinia graminis f. sp. tritici TaxID=56615 RepID=A0A5B0QLN8_PUCGR|nr:hypothetical protein PGTUg99_024495 [Puccinia graminis f. sp. tritici]
MVDDFKGSSQNLSTTTWSIHSVELSSRRRREPRDLVFEGLRSWQTGRRLDHVINRHPALFFFTSNSPPPWYVISSRGSGGRRSAPYWHGRFTNGPVFGEYMAASTLTGNNISLLNYAYGDATVNNGLTKVNAPDTRAQMEMYIGDVREKKAQRGDERTGRVLHCVWIGINDIIQIWTDVIKNGTFQNGNIHGPQTGFEYAVGRVHLEARELLDQVKLLHSHPQVNALHSDFLLMLIPPLEILPNLHYQSKTLAKNNPQLVNTYLEYIGNLTRLYNHELSEGIKALSQDANRAGPDKSAISGNNLAYFDIPKYWYFVRSHPEVYNFVNVMDACWNSTTGANCKAPERWKYYDTLHPSTKMHEYIAQEITVQVNL